MAGQEDLIVITGPTGSGKTRLAMELSRFHSIEVISADSMQVYRHMDIATAKPDAYERAALPHHLIDVVNPDQEFQAAMFRDMAKLNILEIRSRGKTPVVVGGTGLYIQALLYGLAPAPARSERLRAALRSIIDRRGIVLLESMLQRLDPSAASAIKKNDAVRVIRSLEIIFLTGRKASSIYKAHGFQRPLFHARIACIMPDREVLFNAIDKRTHAMLDKGLLDETAMLMTLGYGSELRAMQTLAYRHCIGFMNGLMDINEMIRLIQRDTRRYAKRQVTWMRSRQDHLFFESTDSAFGAISAWLDNTSS